MKIIWNSVYTRLALCILVDVVVYIAILTTLQTMLKEATPPEGYVFERLPVLVGVYDCCSSTSRLEGNNMSLNCGVPDFMGNITSGSRSGGSDEFSCGLQQELGGKAVEVTKVMTPIVRFLKPGPVVIKIASHGQVFYERSDKMLREQWIENSNKTVARFAMIVFMVLGFFLISAFANPKKS